MDAPRGLEPYNTAYFQLAADNLFQVAQQILNARQSILNMIAAMKEEQSRKETTENEKLRIETILSQLTPKGKDDATVLKTVKTESTSPVPSSFDVSILPKNEKEIWTHCSQPIKTESNDDEHDGKTRWPCDRCEKRFNNRSLLKKHYLIHTGEQPYNCDYCNKSFNRRDNMNRHRKICRSIYKPSVDLSKLLCCQIMTDIPSTQVTTGTHSIPSIEQIMARIMSPISSPESIVTPAASPQ